MHHVLPINVEPIHFHHLTPTSIEPAKIQRLLWTEKGTPTRGWIAWSWSCRCLVWSWKLVNLLDYQPKLIFFWTYFLNKGAGNLILQKSKKTRKTYINFLPENSGHREWSYGQATAGAAGVAAVVAAASPPAAAASFSTPRYHTYTTPESYWYYRLWKKLLILGSATFVAEKHGQVYFLGLRIHGMLHFPLTVTSYVCAPRVLNCSGLQTPSDSRGSLEPAVVHRLAYGVGLHSWPSWNKKTHLLLWCNRQVAHGEWTLLGPHDSSYCGCKTNSLVFSTTVEINVLNWSRDLLHEVM